MLRCSARRADVSALLGIGVSGVSRLRVLRSFPSENEDLVSLEQTGEGGCDAACSPEVSPFPGYSWVT